jgi:hypothetical protein
MQAHRIGLADDETHGKLSDAGLAAAREVLDFEIRKIGETLSTAGDAPASHIEAALMQTSRLLRLHRMIQSGHLRVQEMNELVPLVAGFRAMLVADIEYEHRAGHDDLAGRLRGDLANVDCCLFEAAA